MQLEDRLNRLEQQNRWLKIGLVSLLVAGVAAGLLGFTHQDTVPDVVTAKAFHVVGEDGQVLVALEDTFGKGTGDAGTVRTMNSDGGTLCRLGANQEGPGRVSVLDGKGQAIVDLSSSPVGGVITTRNYDGKYLVMIATQDETDAGMIIVEDGKGHDIVALGATKAGHGNIWTLCEGRKLIQLKATADGEGIIAILAEDGARLALITTTDGSGTFAAVNSDGNPIVIIGPGPTGEGSVETFDPSDY